MADVTPSSEKKLPEKSAEKPIPAAPAPIEPGPVGRQLIASDLRITPLGVDMTGLEMLDIPADVLLDVARYLKNSLGFDLLVSVAGVDLGASRQSVVHVMRTISPVDAPERAASTSNNHQMIVLKTMAESAGKDDDGYDRDVVPSLTSVWPAANWHERETYDLMGIVYQGHPDLRRLLMPSDWMGYPMRKTYKEEDPRLVWNRR
jgi:NADH:ubiquinone oxidoreductase subunit C